jgi:hypothetical protein
MRPVDPARIARREDELALIIVDEGRPWHPAPARAGRRPGIFITS